MSKHDARLDARLKASFLEARVDAAGDLSGARVPARAYHDLVAHQRRADRRAGARGADDGPPPAPR